MVLIQIILVLFFAGALGRVGYRYVQREIDASLLVLWVMLWVVAIVLVLFPNASARLAERVGIGRGADLVVYSAVALLFFINFQLNVKLERLNKDITTLNRRLALHEEKNKSL